MGLRKGPMVVAVLALTVGMLLAPAATLAQRNNGGGRGPGNGHPGIPRQPWSGHRGHGHPVNSGRHFHGHHRHFVHRPFFRPFVPFAFAAAPAVVYAAPYAYAPPVSYDPPAYYPPPPTYYSAPPTYYSPPRGGAISMAPTDSVVQYAHGRYELRGDGIAVPYRWVWIPNAPPPPPAAPPPPAEPPAAPPSSNGSNGANGSRPARQTQLYRWTDAAGVVHWTDRLDSVPEQYRAGAKQPRPS